jgi:hypothetical protein
MLIIKRTDRIWLSDADKNKEVDVRKKVIFPFVDKWGEGEMK